MNKNFLAIGHLSKYNQEKEGLLMDWKKDDIQNLCGCVFFCFGVCVSSCLR